MTTCPKCENESIITLKSGKKVCRLCGYSEKLEQNLISKSEVKKKTVNINQYTKKLVKNLDKIIDLQRIKKIPQTPHLKLKILLALFPALIFTQNYAWMTLNAFLGIAFPLIWVLTAWSAWEFTEKNYIIERHFRLAEVAFFFLPISAIVLSFFFGARAVSSSSDEFVQAGAAIGATVGGFFVIIISFVAGITGGIIMHIITNKYSKKLEKIELEQSESLSNKHGVIISLLGVIFMSSVLGSIGNQRYIAQVTEESGISKNSSVTGTIEDDTASQNTIDQKVSIRILEKTFEKGDFEDYISMSFQFNNKTSKEIKGVEGNITFYDIFGNEIYSSKVSYDDGIPANSTNIWNAYIDYNQFIDEHVNLRTKDIEDLRLTWKIETIVYSDGTIEKGASEL